MIGDILMCIIIGCMLLICGIIVGNGLISEME
jgi:hypothetical protein